MFPAKIKNQTLTAVLTAKFMATLCASPSDPNAANDFALRLPAGWDAGAITWAEASYALPSHPALSAVRMPGQAGADLLDALAAGAQQQIGDKTVIVQPSDDPPGASYFYSTGEVVFILFETDAQDAADILAALP